MDRDTGNTPNITKANKFEDVCQQGSKGKICLDTSLDFFSRKNKIFISS